MIEQPDPDLPPAAMLRLTRPIALVGLMGAGKTSVGKRLSGLLRASFVDADVEIEAAAHMSISDVFARYGEPAFRDVERRVIARVLADRPVVLATGGGAFIDPRTRRDIRSRATSVWLRADVDLLWDRVRDRPGRPLLDAPDPHAVLVDLHARRAPVYAEADVVVDSARGASHEAMARAIIAAILDYDRSLPGRSPTLELHRP